MKNKSKVQPPLYSLALYHIRKGNVHNFYDFFYLHLLRIYVRLRFRECSQKNAIKVMNEDWDHLIVLDACRYDMFKEIVDENADYVISGGTGTQSWLKWNFKEEYKDIIYIASNPYLSSMSLKKILGFNPFYKVIEVWDFGWDSSIKTVPPEAVTSSALETLRKHPDKRMIIHYVQPHHPFLSDKDLLKKVEGTWNNLEDAWGSRKITVWDLAKNGDITLERVWDGYKNNLKIVMKEVDKLIKELDGKVILTSDHGNQVGEHGLFGHAMDLRSEQLVKVPWLILKDEKRKIPKTAITGVPYQSSELEMERIKDKIKSLKSRGNI